MFVSDLARVPSKNINMEGNDDSDEVDDPLNFANDNFITPSHSKTPKPWNSYSEGYSSKHGKDAYTSNSSSRIFNSECSKTGLRHSSSSINSFSDCTTFNTTSTHKHSNSFGSNVKKEELVKKLQPA
ncbi:629_t:CDS:1, partial [Acaulospora morrowiae]